MQIEKLKWDSEFFQLNVGKAILSDLSELNYRSLNSYDLIYLFVDDVQPEDTKNLRSNTFLVDSKVTFTHKICSYIPNPSSNVFFYTSSERDPQIIDIGIQSGIYSRFKVDPKFREGKFEELYTLWMQKSINREIANEVLVYKQFDGENIGVITLKEKDNYVDIGILAVNKNHRGQNIGGELVEAAKKYCVNKGYGHLKVCTQLENQKACNFYKKRGFAVESIQYIYHVWNI